MNSNRPFTKRILALVIALLVVLAIGVATPVAAYYIMSVPKVEEDYNPGDPSDPSWTQPTVQTQRITFLSSTETSIENLYVQIPDQGYPVYVRVAVVVNWLKLADCTCASSGCNSSDTCICENCEDGCADDCKTCVEGCTGSQDKICCEECPNCEEGVCVDCKECVDCLGCGGNIECEDCPDCPDCEVNGCNDCTESCTGCKDCREPAQNCKNCKDCAGKVCVDCKECPLCNSDAQDDWDIIFPQPTLDQDYSLEIGGTWEKRDSSGFYYHRERIISGGDASQNAVITIDLGKSTPFIKACERLSTAKLPIDIDGLKVEDCVLRVELMVQTLQAIGSTDDKDIPAWKDAWGEGASNWPK